MASFSHLQTHVVVVSRFIDREDDSFGTPIYGPKEPLGVAYSESLQKIRDADGKERVSAHQLAGDFRIAPEDRVWLPVGLRPGVVPDSSRDGEARLPIAIRSDTSRRNGQTLYQTFF